MAVQLYTHSDFSLLESVLTVEQLVKQAARLGFSALALTDHNNTGGHWEFQRHCRAADIKPIFGVELDVRFGNRSKTRQLVFLALDNAGYGNLLRLASLSSPVSWDVLPQFKGGLALLEGGSTGQLTALVAEGRIAEAQELHRWYTGQFGEDYFLRLEAGGEGVLQRVFPGAPFVLCQDVRYLQPGAADALRVLASLKGTDPCIPPYPMLDWEELCRRAGASAELVERTLGLAERCRVQLPKEQGFPPVDGPSLEELAWQGARKRFGQITPEVRARLDYELAVITELGFADYFLIVADLVRFAKASGIPVGPGRGSAAGSLTAYVLGITEVNPLEWGLVFERFLNPERQSKPDIDVDFCYERRAEVLAYAVERFGREHVAQIGTYGTFGPKGSAQEVRRILGREDPKIAAELRQLKRNRSTHAAGIIVSRSPVQAFSAVYSDRTVPVTHLDMYALEELGALKIDLLGLKTLTLLRAMEQEVQKRQPRFSREQIPLQDTKTFELLGEGKTLGVFQLESELFQDLLKQLQPQTFGDLVALLALGRPGPLSMFREFVARRKDPERVTYLHPELEPILGETYGLILYQEQVMTIAHRLGGLSLGEADLLRRDLAQGKAASVELWRNRFVQGAQRKGLSSHLAQKLFASIAQFSGYAFNKAHSVSYALLSWQAAYFKAHYPEVFCAVLLNAGGSGRGQRALLAEAKSLGVDLLPPSVLHSQVKSSLEGRALRLGLAVTPQLPAHAAQEIAARRGRRPWASLAQLKGDLQLPPPVLETLILMGALDELGERNQHLAELGLAPRTGLELLHAEKELLGIYVSSHPCSPFWPLVEKLQGDLDAVVGEVVDLTVQGKTVQVRLDTPQGPLALRGRVSQFGWKLKPGCRAGVFGRQAGDLLEVEWALPLGPTLLITPKAEDLEPLKGILHGKGGSKPVILLLGEAYHVLPPQYWVGASTEVNRALQAQGIVYTWFDPWKENS